MSEGETPKNVLIDEIDVEEWLTKNNLTSLTSLFISRKMTIESFFEYDDEILLAFVKLINLEIKLQQKFIKCINKIRPFRPASAKLKHKKNNLSKSQFFDHKNLKKEFRKKKKKKKIDEIRSVSRISLNTKNIKTKKKKKLERAKTPTISASERAANHHKRNSSFGLAESFHESQINLRALNHDKEEEFLRKKREEIKKLKQKRKQEKLSGKKIKKKSTSIWSSNDAHEATVKVKPLKHDDSKLKQKRKEIKNLKKRNKEKDASHRRTGSTASLFANPHERTSMPKQMSNEQLRELKRQEKEMREYQKLIKKQERRMSLQSNKSDEGSVIYYDDDSEMSDISVWSNKPKTPKNNNNNNSNDTDSDEKIQTDNENDNNDNNDNNNDIKNISKNDEIEIYDDNNENNDKNENKNNKNVNNNNNNNNENNDGSSDDEDDSNSEVSYTPSDEDGIHHILNDDEKD